MIIFATNHTQTALAVQNKNATTLFLLKMPISLLIVKIVSALYVQIKRMAAIKNALQLSKCHKNYCCKVHL